MLLLFQWQLPQFIKPHVQWIDELCQSEISSISLAKLLLSLLIQFGAMDPSDTDNVNFREFSYIFLI